MSFFVLASRWLRHFLLHLMNFFKASSNFFSIGLCAFTHSCVFFAATTDTGVLLRSVLWSRLVLVCASNKYSLRYNECIFHVCRCRSLHELTIYNFICDFFSGSHSAFFFLFFFVFFITYLFFYYCDYFKHSVHKIKELIRVVRAQIIWENYTYICRYIYILKQNCNYVYMFLNLFNFEWTPFLVFQRLNVRWKMLKNSNFQFRSHKHTLNARTISQSIAIFDQSLFTARTFFGKAYICNAHI